MRGGKPGRRQEVHRADVFAVRLGVFARSKSATALPEVAPVRAKFLLKPVYEHADPLSPVSEEVGQLTGHRDRQLVDALRECAGLRQGGVQFVDTFPQRTGELLCTRQSAIGRNGNLEVGTPDVEAGDCRHGAVLAAGGRAIDWSVLSRGGAEAKPLRIIPVIDIRDGVVVRAVAGDRANYAPIETPLAPGASDPVAVARGLLDACGCDAPTLYVADLDGIEGRGRNSGLIATLKQAFPTVPLWVDDGASTPGDVAKIREHSNVTPVIGSESLASARELAEFEAELPQGFILSLDHRGNERIGPTDVFENPETWPQSVIVMTLGKVGTNAGPDFTRINEIRHVAQGHDIIAAGGIRGLDDLKQLRDMGVTAALVATALHTGALTRADINELNGLAKK